MRAFLDESSRETPAGYCYVVAAAVTIDDPELVREAMRKLRAPRTPVVHWHAESDRRRREIIKRLAELDVHAFAAACHPVAPKRQERARTRLLTSMVGDLEREGVDHLVIESRQEHGNRKDRSTLLAARQAGIATHMTYEHAGKLSEPLLWVADVIAGVLSLHLTGTDSSYYAHLSASLLHVRHLDP